MKEVFPDLERYKRQSFPEAIYCENKTMNQIIEQTKAHLKSNQPIILTRANEKIYEEIKKISPMAKFNKYSNTITINPVKKKTKKYVCIVTAGTSDIPVAEEAASTLEVLGDKIKKIYDVGVAGIHRTFKHLKTIRNSSCVIVCAGMEGALPSIIGGLVNRVVIGVPTSVGYGANFNGLSALLTMLNSCAANVCIVNINDGYGAGVIAHLINQIKG